MSRSRYDLSVRRLEPEILDDLLESDPLAIASRSDLRRLNVLMLQTRIMARLLRRHVAAPPKRLLEIGAGDASFMLAIAKLLGDRWPGVHIVFLDRQRLMTHERLAAFEALGWSAESVTADVFDWTANATGERFDAIAANLFLHHFEDSDLARLLACLAPMAPVFVATEPLRTAFAHIASRMMWMIGANDVTQNDGQVSVRAGFRGRELEALWPADGRWTIAEGRAGPFTHGFAATFA